MKFDEWSNGTNKDPELIEIKPGMVGSALVRDQPKFEKSGFEFDMQAARRVRTDTTVQQPKLSSNLASKADKRPTMGATFKPIVEEEEDSKPAVDNTKHLEEVKKLNDKIKTLEAQLE